ncbi:M14 family metallocarboxypeptidase [Oscillospiraceae bacterium MB08-C2-2]|nr:M14 family metallocarboxypeptidase [Oscillospiraceae bacterium MB08-C2-2]
MYEDFFSSPPTWHRLCRAIEDLKESHKSLKVFPIGKSVLGRDITALSVGNPMNAVLFVGSTHGMEWITTLLLLKFCEKLLQSLEKGGELAEINVAKALRQRSLVIVPCLNPDGVEISLTGSQSAGELADFVESISGGDTLPWQANSRGVDINHNFDAGWTVLQEMERADGITGPAPTRFGGEHPNSEPETQAITTFCMTYQPRSLYSFHSQGEEIYYRYGDRTPCRSQMMGQILASSCGYTLTSPAGLASHGGLKDWFIQTFARPGFTIEVGKGKNPLPIEDFRPLYSRLEEMLMIATLL